ncbi:hypothetical protein ACFL4Z_00305 [candidate division KSB1 bacterium]
MAKGKRRGSIIYQILILLLLAVLLLTLYVPKNIWNKETKNEEECHSRLLNIWTAETFFRQKTKGYTSSIDTLIKVLKNDLEIMAILDTVYTQTLFPDLDSIETIYSMPLDSIVTCPETGLQYNITLSDSMPLLTIECPNKESEEKVYYLYKKKIKNHGSISDGKVSWE